MSIICVPGLVKTASVVDLPLPSITMDCTVLNVCLHIVLLPSHKKIESIWAAPMATHNNGPKRFSPKVFTNDAA